MDILSKEFHAYDKVDKKISINLMINLMINLEQEKEKKLYF